MKINRIPVLSVFLLTIFTAALFFGSLPFSAMRGGQALAKEKKEGGKEKKQFVRAVKVALGAETVRLDAIGTGRGVQAVVLYPEGEGRVVEVAFKSGQRVKKGKVLLRLDHAEEKLEVALAKVRAADAKQLLDRYSQARARVVPEAQIETARNALAEAELVLAQAEVALEKRVVRAPFDGVIGLTEMDVGDRVDTDTVIASFDDFSALYVDFDAPELFLGRIAKGDAVALRPWTAETDEVMGEVVALDSRVDPDTRTFQVRVRLANDKGKFRPGMSFRVGLVLRGQVYPVVPEASIVWGGNGSFVWAIRDGKAAPIPLVIVQRNPGEALVDAALAEGDLVVYEGVQRMRKGRGVTYEVVTAAKPEPGRKRREMRPSLRTGEEQ